jgi:hypothetical protein
LEYVSKATLKAEEARAAATDLLHAGAAFNPLGALFASFASMGNPVLSQLIMNTSKPLFLGTTAHFQEFQRSWDEYLSLLKATQPGLQEAQILALFKTSLDPASGTQLKRLMEQKPTITTEEYMRIMEKTFGQDASGKTRQAWIYVQLRIPLRSTGNQWMERLPTTVLIGINQGR